MNIKQAAPQGANGARIFSELTIRIASAIAMIAAALVTAWLGGWVFSLFWAAAAIAIFWEWIRMAGADGYVSRFVLVAIAGVTLVVLATLPYIPEEHHPHLPLNFRLYFFLLAIGCVGISLFLGRSLRDRAWIASGFCYAAVIAFFPSFLREIAPHGLSNILWVFAVVWATDIAAYFVGRTLGGPKLWPRVSPNKTWSGFCGGLVAGTVSGVAIVFVLQHGPAQLPWGLTVLFSMIASMLSQGGDLAESALKRYFGVKDSSFLIPGHGGVMDRLDGFWAAVFFLGMCLILTHMMHNGTV